MNLKVLSSGIGLLAALLYQSALAVGAAGAAPVRDLSVVGGQWTWVGGSNLSIFWEHYGEYGTKGIPAPGNRPGVRTDALSWTDSSGNLWLFGGFGRAESGLDGHLNDLWKWDGANWTWVAGSKREDQFGTYGTKGVASPGNAPGGRSVAVSWIDASGNLWLFGGSGHAASAGGFLNDLWKWDGSNWTWVSGSNEPSQSGVYGVKGVAAPENVPGARMSSVSWTDSSGNLWLFGGSDHVSSSFARFNDLWKWDGTGWTWMSGANTGDAPGIYGTKGVAAASNVPGARQGAVSWTDASGAFWLLGGRGIAAGASLGVLNDLWRWDGTNWTWMSGSDAPSQYGVYGTKGAAAPGNVPGARERASARMDAGGTLWLFGGQGYAAAGTGELNDLWRWNGTTWTWMSGSDAAGQLGTYGAKGIPAPGNVPGARHDSVLSIDSSGNLWLFSGEGNSALYSSPNLNDLWKWDGTNWAWMGGTDGVLQDAMYGTKGVAAPENFPGSKRRSISWTDASGNAWLFGGEGGQGRSNALWKWDGTNWTWMSGADSGGQHGTYGTKGVASPGNVPGARFGSVSWKDSSGNLWLFGGYGFDESIEGHLNDLWKWDGASWTWVSGSKVVNQLGTYGTKGIAASGNVPGARYQPVSWTDADGAFWLFGGGGYSATGGGVYLNDLWKWDGAQWAWMSGTGAGNQYGTYGVKGVAAPGNAPGGRAGAVSWRDADGDLWLFGCEGYAESAQGRLNDLWRFDGSNWTWVSGSKDVGQTGSYGTKGLAAAGNVPGERVEPVSWTDVDGRFWLFGGVRTVEDGPGDLNDLWMFDGAAWTWVSGSSDVAQTGRYGTRGIADPGNVPGSRYESVSWTDTSGNLWLYGGYARDSVGNFAVNDLWVFGTTCTSLAPPTAGNGGPYGIGATIALTASTIEGATYLWTGPNDFTSTEQNPTIPNGTLAMAGDYSVTVIVGGCPSNAATTTVVVLPSPTLAVTKIGSGTGSVVSSPGGIECGSACAAAFPAFSQVTLTATPDGGSRFAGWIGEGCFGTDPCTVAMDTARHVSATFLPSGGIGLYTLTQCRIVDTRNATGPYGGPALSAGTARAFTIAGQCGVPADASAVALNVTVANPTSAGSLTVYPGTGLTPGTSTVSFAAGRTRANNSTMGLVDGILSVVNHQVIGTTDVIIDVSGYYR